MATMPVSNGLHHNRMSDFIHLSHLFCPSEERLVVCLPGFQSVEKLCSKENTSGRTQTCLFYTEFGVLQWLKIVVRSKWSHSPLLYESVMLRAFFTASARRSCNYKTLQLFADAPVLVISWCLTLDQQRQKMESGWILDALILPQGWAAQAESVPLQRASLVSTQVFPVTGTDGKPSTFMQLQREVFRHLAIRAHQPSTVHIPEPAIDTWECGGSHAQGQKHCIRVFCVMSVIAGGGTDLFQNWKPQKKIKSSCCENTRPDL